MADPKLPASDDRLDEIGKRLFAEARAEHAAEKAELDRWWKARERRDGGISTGSDGDGCHGGGDGD